MKCIITVLLLSLPAAYLFSQDTASTTFISGTVTDSFGKFVEGMSLRWKKQPFFALSDGRGKFHIRYASLPDTLLISHIAYRNQAIFVTDPFKPLQILARRNTGELEEVLVSTGYQKIKPNEVTGAVQVIDQELLQEQTGTNILQRMNNVAPGVRFDTRRPQNSGLQKLNINIRGLSTINGPLDPLVVLDGFIYEGDINNIDPNLVDNITILKDAAATSIWGARAGNGVIVITTKKGHIRKPVVSFNTNAIVESKPDLFDIYHLPASEYIDVENFLFQNGHYNRQIQFQPWLPLTPSVEVFLQGRNGLISPDDSTTRINNLRGIDGRNDFEKFVLGNAVIQQYAVNVSGGSDKHLYSVGAGYTHNKTAYDALSRKINITIAQTYRPVNKLAIDLNVFYTNGNGMSGAPSYSSIKVGSRAVPYLQFADDLGNALPVSTVYRKSHTDQLLPGQLLSWEYYPLEDYKHNYTKTVTEELFASAAVQYDILKFLKFTGAYQYQQQRVTNDGLADTASFAVRTTYNNFSFVDQVSGLLKHAVPLGGIRNLNEALLQTSTLRGQFNIDILRGHHGFSAIVGAEVRESKQNNYSFTSYGYEEDPLSTVPVDYTSLYQTIVNFGYSNISGAPQFYQSINRFVSMYASGVYRLNKKYSLSGSARRDGANIFGQQSNDRWKPLWSAGAAWDVDAEPFLRFSWLSRLKLRATYGVSGNVDTRRTALPVAELGFPLYNDLPVYRIAEINNPYLRWERISTINLGVDFSMLSNRISGSIDYYRKRGRDLYGAANYDYTIWGVLPIIQKNVGGMKGNGIDLIINTQNTERVIKWSTTVLFSVTKSRTAEYYDERSKYTTSIIGDGSVISPVVGKDLYGIAAYRWGGLDSEGNPQGFLDGKPSTDYLAIIETEQQTNKTDHIVYKGSAVPEVYGSVINRVNYKGFFLTLNISFRASYYFLKPATSYMDLYNNGVGYADLLNRWKQPGDEAKTTIPSMVYPLGDLRDLFYTRSEINVEKGDHIRLEYINLGYEFTNLPTGQLRSLTVFANAANLGVLWKANDAGIDPAYVNAIKPSRAFTFGLRASF